MRRVDRETTAGSEPENEAPNSPAESRLLTEESRLLMTDAELLEEFLGRRNAVAFETLVRRHGPLVLRVCRDVLDDPDDAEDAFQATFLVLVRRAGSIRDPDSLGRWLHEVANRVALRARADARRRYTRQRQGGEMTAPDPGHEDAERRELRAAVHAELNRLPENLRAPLILCYLEERSYEEAARRLRLPLGTLKARLSRGRDLLRSRLVRRGIVVTVLLLDALLSEEALAVPPDLVASTVNSGTLAARRPGPLPETIPARVASLVERERRARSLRRRATLVALAVLLAAGGFVVVRDVRAGSPPIGLEANSPTPPNGASCHGE
jgi:RNA polymerase sigma factor (sigma-70 family)